MNITYLFGAGASYYAVPTVKDMNEAFKSFEELIPVLINKGLIKQELIRPLKTFQAQMQNGYNSAKNFGTIDTYAKFLSLTNNGDLVNLKVALSVFFTVWQELNKDLVKQKTKDGLEYKNIDHRYIGLLANYMKAGINETPVLEDNIKFITWNYDTQLERALALFTNKSKLCDALDLFNVYPYNYPAKKINPTIVHLNGVAGIYTVPDDIQTKTLFNRTNETGSIENILNKTLYFLDSIEKRSLSNNTCFTYAWEEDEISVGALQYSEEIIKQTDILVVVGYSFPTFNDKIDKKLFQIFTENGRSGKIYFQDPNAEIELLTKRFDLKEEDIIIVKNTNQFALPLEFMNKYQAGSKIEIITATYGGIAGYVDIKENVQKLVNSGYLQGPVTPSVFGIEDPAFGIVKTFTVEYRIKGKAKNKQYKDGEFFLFD